MTTDRQGNIWISTTMGIWQYNAARKQFYSYINGNGLTSHEYMLGSMMRDADDRIAFGTADGITTFYPEVVNGRKEKLGEVYLTGFMVNGKSRSCMGEKFTLPYKDNTFLLEFSMLNYKWPGRHLVRLPHQWRPMDQHGRRHQHHSLHTTGARTL